MRSELDGKGLLAEIGVKSTRQRISTLNALLGSDRPVSAEDLHQIVSSTEDGEGINLSTVYRILDMLTDEGVVSRTADPVTGIKQYELLIHGHRHHLRCTECDRIVPLAACPVGSYVGKIELETGFDITGHVLEMYGICEKCRASRMEGRSSAMDKVRIDVVSGFLGAGKTTLIRKMITEREPQERIVVIENEFGEVGIDGALLGDFDIEVREISAGCICCTVVGDFEKAIADIMRQHRPDRIIIEPSGVGKLSEILKVLGSGKVTSVADLGSIFTVVDVNKYDVYARNFGEFFLDQISHADVIVLSRTQSATAEKIEAIHGKLLSHNPDAVVVTTPWDQFSMSSLAAGGRGAAVALVCGCCGNEDHVHEHSGCSHHEDEHCECSHHDPGYHDGESHDHPFESWHGYTPRRFAESEIRRILAELDNNEEYGHVLRSKGILENSDGQWIQFHFVPGEIAVGSCAPDFTGRLCVIGQNLNRPNLSRIFGVL